MIESHVVIELFKNSDQKAISVFYNDNKNGFILFANRYNLNKDDVLDIYQDAIIALIENAKKGKIDDLKSSLSTYLFAIGKYMIFQKFKKETPNNSFDDLEKFEMLYEDYNEDALNSQIINLQKGLEKLGEQCRKVLILFYYEEKKLDEIQEILHYTNKDVLKSQKSRCLKQLKELIKK